VYGLNIIYAHLRSALADALAKTRNKLCPNIFAYAAFEVGDVSRKGNAVIAWTFDPSDDERALVEGCLRSS
jgi:hypothetical protein